MNIGNLLFASYVYSKIESSAYREFVENTNCDCDLKNPTHRAHLLEWLRKWGMRNLPKKDNEAMSKKLVIWYEKHEQGLPHKNIDIWDLNETALEQIKLAYKDLLESEIASVTINRKNRNISFGSVGVAKILFALRPKALPLWDNAIRDKLKQEEKIEGNSYDELYLSFIKYLKNIIIPELKLQSANHSLTLDELPVQVDRLIDPNRRNTTVLKLIDEYYWMTIKRKMSPLDVKTLQKIIELL